MILAIDTSTDQASVALLHAQRIWAEQSWTTRGNHSRHLTRVIRELLPLAGATISDITAVVVARGPGSFNGIRVAVSEGKGLCMALDVPLAGISTLDVIAFQSSQRQGNVWAMVSVGRDRLALAHYSGSGEYWRRDSEYLVASPSEAARLVKPGDVLAGEPVDAVIRELGRETGVFRPDSGVAGLRRAGFLAELGRRYFDSGGEDQLYALEPLYVRRSAAEEKRVIA